MSAIRRKEGRVIQKSVRIFAPALLPLILIWIALQGGCAGAAANKGGILDLSDWNFSRQGNISLDGNWAFYWNELISPGGFSGAEPTGYFSLPSYWTRYDDLHLPSRGFATYRLAVKTAGSAGPYSISIPAVYTEYALWINGSLVHACGSFAQDQAVYLHPQTYDFYLAGTELEIVLQIKNEAHAYGGVSQSIRLGTPGLIHREYNLRAAVDIILISICLSAGIYYLILCCFRKSSREFLWFSVLCFSVSVRSLFSNTTLIMQVIPGLPFWLGSMLVTLTIPAIIIAMLFYARRLYMDEMMPSAFRALMAVHIIYALAVLILPSAIYSSVFAYYLAAVGAACALGMYVSVKAVRHRKKESCFFLAGMLLLITGALFDSLIYTRVLSFSYVLSGALCGFIVLQAILLAKRYSDAFRHAELLSLDLQASLNKIMNTETAYMSAQMKPHFLYNALSTIAECCETNPAEAGNLLLSLSKYLRQTLDFENLGGLVPLKKELELVRAYTSIERARFSNIEVVFELPDPLPQLQIPPLTLQPLVENAIRHGLRKKRDGGSVTVRVAKKENSAAFTVEDNGVGMADGALKNIAVLPKGSVSIGLYNINTRLTRLYGKGLSITSAAGQGTCVSFEIPYSEEN